jgi:hypothetical protein
LLAKGTSPQSSTGRAQGPGILRSTFRQCGSSSLAIDDATWLRAQGWCVSQALIALGYYTPENNPPIHAEATRWLAEVLDG